MGTALVFLSENVFVVVFWAVVVVVSVGRVFDVVGRRLHGGVRDGVFDDVVVGVVGVVVRSRNGSQRGCRGGRGELDRRGFVALVVGVWKHRPRAGLPHPPPREGHQAKNLPQASQALLPRLSRRNARIRHLSHSIFVG